MAKASKKKELAWSFSRLNSYEQCPKKYYHSSVARDVVEAENETLRYGKEVHKALELYVSKGKRLPMHLTHLKTLADKFKSPDPKPDEILVEQQMAITRQMSPTGWFDNDVWARAIMDYVAIRGSNAVMVDYKTGRMKDDFTQLKLAAAMLMLHRDDIDTVQVVYWWIKEKAITSEFLCREDMQEIWNEFFPRVERYEEGHRKEEFPARAGFLCKNYCPVKQCKYNGE